MLIKGIFVCDYKQYKKTNIRINNNLIEDIGDGLVVKDNEEVVELRNKNMVIMPYFYDLNIRLKNNIFKIKNIDKILNKAKKSGIGKIAIMPDCNPAINNELTLSIMSKYNQTIPVCYSLDNNELSSISTMIKKGSKAIYLDSLDSNIIRRTCEYALIDKTPIFYKAFDNDLSYGCMHHHLVSSQMGIEGIDEIAETSQVAKMIEIGKFFDSKIVFNSIVSSKSIELIYNNKEKNDFFTQTPIHHFILSDKECQNFNTIAKIFPPLKDEEEKERLIQALIDGKIDILSSIQAHEHKIKKDLPFEDASYGVNEIDVFFSLCYTYLVKNKLISLQELSKLLSSNAQKIFNEKQITIKESTSLDNLVLVDLDKDFVVNNETSLYNKHHLYSQIIPFSNILK